MSATDASEGGSGHDESVEPNTKGSQKRADYLEWEDYFMAIAMLAAKRSKDPVTQVGACIVNADKKIVGVGYNGMPTGLSDDQFPWSKGSENELENKGTYVCHAEMNAVMFRNAVDLKGCTMYVTLYPCNECAKIIIQAGIKEVIYYDGPRKKDSQIETKYQAAMRMLKEKKINTRQFESKRENKTITIDIGRPREEENQATSAGAQP